MLDFLQEKEFDREKYDMYLRRIHYDDRDATMYDQMLHFLFPYIVSFDQIEDRQGLMEEYSHWNSQLIDKCLYHIPHDLPYVNICRAYQSFVCLMAGELEEGMEQLSLIGEENFQYDGKAPKIIMTQDGRRYEPISKLFLLYNYAKVLHALGWKEEEEAFRQKYVHAFTRYQDSEHKEHDAFYQKQMEEYKDMLFYPIYQRVYKMKGGPADFYVYFDEEHFVPISQIINHFNH